MILIIIPSKFVGSSLTDLLKYVSANWPSILSNALPRIYSICASVELVTLLLSLLLNSSSFP